MRTNHREEAGMRSKKVRNNTGPDHDENTYVPPLACILDVFSTGDNKGHETLLNEALAAIREDREVEDGYTVSFSSNSFLTIAEWISLKRRCCHFLSFQIGFLSGDQSFSLTLWSEGHKRFSDDLLRPT